MNGLRSPLNLIHRQGGFGRKVQDEALAAYDASDIAAQTASRDKSLLRVEFERIDIINLVRVSCIQCQLTAGVSMAIGVSVTIFVIEDVHRCQPHVEVLVERQQFEVSCHKELVGIRSLRHPRKGVIRNNTAFRTDRKDIAFGTGKVECLGTVQSREDTFGTYLPERFAQVCTELQVHTLEVSLVPLKELLLFGHVTLAGKHLGFIQDVDIRGEQRERRILLTEITHSPVEVVANLALDIDPGNCDKLRGRGEVILHARIKAEHGVCSDTFPRAETKVKVRSHKLNPFHIGHRDLTVAVLRSTEIRCLRDTTNSTCNFEATVCVGRIDLARYLVLIVGHRSCSDTGRERKDTQSSSHHF